MQVALDQPGYAIRRRSASSPRGRDANVTSCAALIALIIAILTGGSPGAAAPMTVAPPAQASGVTAGGSASE
jgi:hypothetical protein